MFRTLAISAMAAAGFLLLPGQATTTSAAPTIAPKIASRRALSSRCGAAVEGSAAAAVASAATATVVVAVSAAPVSTVAVAMAEDTPTMVADIGIVAGAAVWSSAPKSRSSMAVATTMAVATMAGVATTIASGCAPAAATGAIATTIAATGKSLQGSQREGQPRSWPFSFAIHTISHAHSWARTAGLWGRCRAAGG